MGSKLKRGALPAALSALIMSGLSRLHTEVGIPATTVDMMPVQRTSISTAFAPFTNRQLSTLRDALEERAGAIQSNLDLNAVRATSAQDLTSQRQSEDLLKEISKQIGKINVEVIGRRNI